MMKLRILTIIAVVLGLAATGAATELAQRANTNVRSVNKSHLNAKPTQRNLRQQHKTRQKSISRAAKSPFSACSASTVMSWASSVLPEADYVLDSHDQAQTMLINHIKASVKKKQDAAEIYSYDSGNGSFTSAGEPMPDTIDDAAGCTTADSSGFFGKILTDPVYDPNVMKLKSNVYAFPMSDGVHILEYTNATGSGAYTAPDGEMHFTETKVYAIY